MIYLIRFLWPAYLAITVFMILSVFAEWLFEGSIHKKKLIIRFFISFIWPLSLLNRKGRSIFKSNFKRVFN